MKNTNQRANSRPSIMSTKQIHRGYKLCQRRISALWRRRQRIEAVLYMSVLVEFFIKESILRFERIVEGAAVSCHVMFNPRNLYTKKDIENQPLGYLIRLLDTYTRDKELIRQLREFAKKRNKCVHKLMECKITDLNRDLNGFDIFFYKLIIKLMKLNVQQMNLMKKSFDFVCDQCFTKMLPKQIKL